MAEKRKRSQNFTSDEKDRLVKLLIEHKDTILNKKTDGSTNEAKSYAWIAVMDSFNTAGSIYRSKESLMKMWEKLKSESKIYYTAIRRDTTQTGGGPSMIKIDPILEQVCSILGRGCTGIIGVPDSDCVDNTFEDATKFIFIDKENDIETMIVEPQEAVYRDVEIPSEEVIRKTPLWSRRRPVLSQMNERTEAMSSLCSSFKDVNKKKIDIEDLKRQLLDEEINFKQRLYDFQLKAAEKEFEIKNEILCQIKGGALNLETLFGVQQKKTE